MKFTHNLLIIATILCINSTIFSMLLTKLTIPQMITFYDLCDANPISRFAAIHVRNLIENNQEWKAILNDTKSTSMLLNGIRNKYVNKLEIAAYLGTPAAIDFGKNYIQNNPDSLTNLNALFTSLARLKQKNCMWENEDTDVATNILKMTTFNALQYKSNYFPPLIEATILGKIEFVTLLLDNGAGTENTMCPNGGTPVMLAAAHGQDDMLDFLIKHGANINASSSGETALFLAISSKLTKTVKKLLENGADITVKNEKDETPLQMAQRLSKWQYGFEEIVQVILSKIEYDDMKK